MQSYENSLYNTQNVCRTLEFPDRNLPDAYSLHQVGYGQRDMAHFFSKEAHISRIVTSTGLAFT